MADASPVEEASTSKKQWRALVAYWILGICNNYGYVVMLVAANDIITRNEETKKNKDRNCSYMSTGAILLADIIPSMCVKFLVPFMPLFITARVIVSVSLSALGFVLVAFSEDIAVAVVGVVSTSMSCGLGEVSYLTYSTYYDKNVVSTWSSGTGGAGLTGALSYTALQNLGFKTTLLAMLIIPTTMGITFFCVLPKPLADRSKLEIQRQVNEEEVYDARTALIKKFKHISAMLRYIVPFALVYFLEYFINQATFELINFRNTFLSPEDQYRWLQIVYQCGVLISRSSVNLFHFKQIWLMSILQAVNVVIFTTEVIYYYTPSFWIILTLSLWEGLLGGAAYVNTFYRVSSEVEEEKKQFSIAVIGVGDSIGITLAGIVAIYAHNAICELPPPTRSA